VAGSYLLYTLRRLAAAVVIAALVSAITFVMLRVLRPESFPDPRPLPTQLAEFLWGVFTQFDLGNSRQPPFRPVSDLILERLPADLSLFLGALAIGGAAGVAGAVVVARAVAYRHTLPTAIAPTLTLTGAYLPLLVGNALLVEQVFNIPGVFRYTTGAVSNGDFPLLQGLVLIGAFMVVLGNLAADLLLGRLDPRTRMG
jgi:ABC-type dipeptide/oligopeptide/nickel transport system permease component